MAVLRVALLLLVAVAVGGCWSPPQPPCAFSCATDGICPAGYSCAADGVCHRDDGQGTCNIPPQVDAAPDAVTDGGNADASGS